jgi:hypothetical protein
METDDITGRNNFGSLKKIPVVRDNSKDAIKNMINPSQTVTNDQKLGDEEYKLCLKKALRDALDENDIVSKKLHKELFFIHF